MRLLGGLRPWVIQRLSALYVLAFVAAVALILAFGRPMGFAAWRAWVSRPVVALMFFLFFTSLFSHAWVGVRDVVLDYVHPLPLRALLLTGLGLGLLALEAWVVLILAGLR